MDMYASLAVVGGKSAFSGTRDMASREVRSLTLNMLLDALEERVLDLLSAPEAEELDDAVEAWRRGLGALTGWPTTERGRHVAAISEL
jgi:hypothetical protein